MIHFYWFDNDALHEYMLEVLLRVSWMFSTNIEAQNSQRTTEMMKINFKTSELESVRSRAASDFIH